MSEGIVSYHMLFKLTIQSVEFCVTIFHCPETTALSKAFPFYVISFYWVVSFMVVRHCWLSLDYRAAI